MKIVELRAENVKRLSAVEIKPDGALVVVGGKNGAGKSSLLDSIVYALGGAGSLPGKPVRNGEEKAEIELTLDSEPKLVIRRRIKEDGKTELEIKQIADGVSAKVSKPQDLLKSLCGTLAFDPLAFTRLRPQDQVDMLRRIVGVDVSDLDAEANAVFEERTGVNRDTKSLAAQVAAAVRYDDAPAAEVSIGRIADEIEETRRHNAKVRELWASVESLDADVAQAERQVSVQKERVAELEAELTKAKASLTGLQAELKQTRVCRDNEKRHAEAAIEKDDSALREQLSAAEETNRKVRANQQRDELIARQKEAQAKADELTKRLDEIRADRISRMANATWPVEGIGFDEHGVTFNDLPFEQCSSAEQLRISTAIGASQNPKLRVWMIRDGSLLDEDNLAAIHDLAVKYDAQIWIERVGRGQECTLIIEDGTVAESRQREPALA